jgi:hypothetical protein
MGERKEKSGVVLTDSCEKETRKKEKEKRKKKMTIFIAF